jgi:phosphoribosylformylglycinamidine cyclo-ligase
MHDNVPRALGPGLEACIELASYARPPLFDLIQRSGPVAEEEMRRVFNLGVGLVAVVAPELAEAACRALRGAGEQAWVLGEVTAGAPGEAARARFV